MRLPKDERLDSDFHCYRQIPKVTVRESSLPFLKRCFDFSLSLVGLIVSSPFWFLVAAAIWVEDGRPIFYFQNRLGKGGREFRLFKFRSMIKDAEQQTGPVWSGEYDHRITRVGRFIRPTALDELPQLLNILRGDMSFVGPRAERAELTLEIEKDVPGFNLRLLVVPGLTGLAQVYGKYNTHPRNKLRYDLLYIKNQNFWLDIKLILLSFWITFMFKWSDAEKKVDKLIGELMLEDGAITEEQLKNTIEYQKERGGKIGQILVKRGYISESKLLHFLNVQVALNGKDIWNGNGKRKKINRLIGELMLEEGIITEKQLEEALEYQRISGDKIGQSLLRKGYISESELKYFLNKQSAITGL